MSELLNEIQRVVGDLRSDKSTARNKAMELLDQKMSSSRELLHKTFVQSQTISWSDIFLAVKDSIFKHASNLQDAREKTFRTLADKCYLYGNCVDKIIDFNLEIGMSENHHFLAKSMIFNAFEEGIKHRIVVKHFGDNFINMLHRGIYLSPSYVSTLKVGEYSCILSYLFDLNIENDGFLRSKVLKCITKTVQLAQQRVQLHADLADYLPTLSFYTADEKNSDRRIEIVRLYRIFVDELAVNYHYQLCVHMQQILPKLCDYHNDDTFREDTKNMFFECVTLSLHALYPKLNTQDFGTFQVPIHESWPKTMQKLKTIIHMEIRKNSMGRNKLNQLNSDKFSSNFIQMSALITYILLWHMESNTLVEDGSATNKRARIDQMESLINLIDSKETSFNEIWFAIFAELLQLSNSIINPGNYELMLKTTLNVQLIYGNGQNLRNVRLCLLSLLGKEQELLQTQSIPADYLHGIWSQVAGHLISDSCSVADVIVEKHNILQSLVRHNKLTRKDCATLLQNIQTNEFLRRNECVATIRDIFINAECCGLDKASSELEPIINWAYGSERSTATQIINNIAAIDVKLLADTFAIGIINFLDEEQLQQLGSNSSQTARSVATNLQLLKYKYNKQLICLDGEFQSQLRQGSRSKSVADELTAKNCLFQNNYELLMRLLNLPISKEHTTIALIKNLKGLQKLICTMERLLHYKVFDSENFAQCPLIKRIGLFLSHIEFQYKANEAERMNDHDLRDILDQQMAVLDVFHSNEILRQYLEKQPIEMLLEFIGALLKHNCTRRDPIEAAERDALMKQCLHILGRLCANFSYGADAFQHITTNAKKTRFQSDQVMLIIKMLCSCKSLTTDTIEWLVEQVKNIFQRHYTNVHIISELVEQMPTIFYFVYNNEDLLDDMMQALMSLLKLAIKKSYPTQLAASIVRCVADIAQRCPNIFTQENFATICYSVAKFLSMPTLEVRLATTATLTLLLNSNYCVPEDADDAVGKCELHLQFCNELYQCIDWNKFLFDNEDLRQNSNAVAIQTLVAFFGFSSFHQEIALQQLLQHTARHKLSETDFCAISIIVPDHQLTMRQLMMPYTDAMIHLSRMQHVSIAVFPYYLSYESKGAFLKDHAKSIMAYTYLYSQPEEVTRLQMFNESEFTDILRAYDVMELSNFSEQVKQQLAVLQHNAEEFQLNLKDIPLSAKALYYTVCMLQDKHELNRLFGGTVLCNRDTAWYSLKADMLFNCLALHANTNCKTWSQDQRIQAISQYMFEQPLVMVELLGMLKTDCYKALLSSHVLRSFFLYCAIADAMLDAMKALESSANKQQRLLQENCAYFVRDIWFFVCRFLLHTKCGQLHRAGLKFIELMQTKRCFDCNGSAVRLNEFAKQLLAIVQHMETMQLRELAVKVQRKFSASHKEQIVMESLLEEQSEYDLSKDLAELEDIKMPNIGCFTVAQYVSSYMKHNRFEGLLPGLREYLAKHKHLLPDHERLLFHLINRLIHMVREAGTKASSLEALKCLAEIGPLKMQQISYYFQADYDAFEQSDEEPMLQFIRGMLDILEKELFHFKTSTQQPLIQVVGHVVNCNAGSRLSMTYPNLHLFFVAKRKTSFLNSYLAIPAIDWVIVLQASEHLDYEQWMCAFMSQAFKSVGWTGFDEFAGNSFRFANACLQPFIKLLLANAEGHLQSLCSMLDHFFGKVCEMGAGIYQEKRAIKLFLYICERIRLINNWTIPINFSNAIMASNHCQAYFLSIMYLELWACAANDTPDADILANESFQKCAKKAYESIYCLDAMSGFLNPLRSRVDYLSLNNNLIGCLLESDNLDTANTEMSINIMKSNGMLSQAHLYQRSMPDQQIDYEALWRLSQWDESVEVQPRVKGTSNINQELEFQKQHYLALRSITRREEANTLSAINNAYECIHEVLRDISVECLQSVYKYMTWLCTLQQAEDFAKIQFCPTLSSEQIIAIFDKWQTELNLTYGNFTCKEYVLSHQIALFKMPGTRATRRIEQYYKKTPLDEYLLKAIDECKNAGKMNMATKYVATLRGMPHLTEASKICVLLEDADLHVRMGNHQIAKATLEHLVSNKDFQYCLQRVPALLMQGKFLLNSSAQNFSYVLENNFNRSTKLLDQFVTHKDTLKAKYPDLFAWPTFSQFENDNRKATHAAIAKYADLEYQMLHNYLNSQDYQTITEIIQQNCELVDTLKKRTNASRDHQLGAISMTRFAKLDQNELKRISDNLTEHLCTAIRHYVTYCQLDSGASSAEIYRIIALWFTNETNQKILETISEQLQHVPSYKFICALNQIVGRLSSQNVEFRRLLIALLVRCGKEHPQQTLYKLCPLVFAHMDGSEQSSQRADIAESIIAQICEGDSTLTSCSRQFKDMFPALIQFANSYIVRQANGRTTASGVPEKLQKLNKLQMDMVQCPTMSLSPQPNGQYEIISIGKWIDKYTLCGGINAPIKVECLCSDGVVRAQLIKGKDDLRQDAVMQQVFGIVNELLKSDSECINRKLQLRTYTVMPLSPRCGILEWCSNTIPLGQYLVGNGTGGAHVRYRPQDWTNKRCREMLAAALQKTPTERRKIYKKVCENVKPVFHYFLMEKFHTPGIWFERRLAYINSVALTSMVGYVLGLGDRHVQNILIDEQTAEVVHIDFGIAFEAAKIQRTPETVPFRLTRDIVAPMGICGTNGVFNKSCETIVHILRQYKSVLITILEVLLYDPLFHWGVLSNGSENEESKNALAQRALLLVRHKLEGRESGLMDSTSVEAQVQRLINEAMLPANLALNYPGWDPQL